IVAAVAFGVALVVGLVALADLTQNRPDEVRPGSVTTMTFRVTTRDVQRGDDAAAATLWAVCAGTVGGSITSPVAVGDAYAVTISPAIGEHGRKRLTGCIEDVTVDRVKGHVVSLVAAG